MMGEGIALRNMLCITMNEGAVITLGGRTIFEQCSFASWDRLSPEIQAGLIAQGLVATEAGHIGAFTRDAVLDSLALKMAGVVPKLTWPPVQPKLWQFHRDMLQLAGDQHIDEPQVFGGGDD